MPARTGPRQHGVVSAESVITTERLRLRLWRDADAGDFAEMNADPRVMEYFPAPLGRAESDELLGKILAHFGTHGFGPWLVEERASGEFLGFTGLMIPTFDAEFTPAVEIGWRYARSAWGHGYASEAARACLAYGFDALNLERVVSFTSRLNLRSIAVMERIGMRFDSHFEHPKLETGDRLRPHVLYVIDRPAGD